MRRPASGWRACVPRPGDWLKAELHYRFLSRARPEWVQVRLQLSRPWSSGTGADAEQELVAAREDQPDNVLVLRRLAELYERTGRAKPPGCARCSRPRRRCAPAALKAVGSRRRRARADCTGNPAAYTAPALKTANLAIVFTDIQGFTERTSRQTLEQNQRLLRDAQ